MSLRRWLTLPYVALVLLVALTIGSLSYVTGRHAVQTMSEKLLLETIDRIGQAVDRHVVGSAAALEAAFPDGMPAPPSIDADLTGMRSRFWIATSLHLDPNNYVYFGNRQGQFFGLWRHSAREGELRIKLRPEEPRNFQRFIGLDGAPGEAVPESTIFDPRTRPWFRAGQTNPSHAWTAIYIDYRTSELVATRARRVLDTRGDFAGVVATDLSLRALSDFVRRLRLSENGLAFIIEHDGNLIASSRSSNVVRRPDGKNARINVADSPDGVERSAYAAVRQALVASAARSGSLNFIGPDAETHELAFAQIKDAAGLDWIIVVAAPRRDLMGGIGGNVIRTAVIATAASIAAVLLGLWILGWISRDLARLAQAARAIGEGRVDDAPLIDRRDEIGELADCFRQMQRRLRTDHLTGLVNRETLLRRIEERIRQHRRATDSGSFAVLFVDVDDFKLVNDRLGHDVGDRALIEIGRRLRAATRTTDLVARYAGDEFVVMLDSVDSTQMAEHVRVKVERALDQPLSSVDSTFPESIDMSGSVGLAVFSDADDSAEALVRRADAEMYRYKSLAKMRPRTSGRQAA